MGSQVSHQNPSLTSLNPSQYTQSVTPLSTYRPSHGTYTIMTHKISHQPLFKYTLTFPTALAYNTYYQCFLHRYREQYIVSTLDFIPHSTPPSTSPSFSPLQNLNLNFCGSTYTADVYIEYIPVRLGDITDIPYPDCLYIMRNAIIGFGGLYGMIGYFWVQEDHVCVNGYGEVKVWMNVDLGVNWPEEGDGEGGDGGHGKGRMESECNMVNRIITMIQENTNLQQCPIQPSQYFIKKHKKYPNFKQALDLLNQYVTQYGTILPKYCQSVFEVFRQDDRDEGMADEMGIGIRLGRNDGDMKGKDGIGERYLVGLASQENSLRGDSFNYSIMGKSRGQKSLSNSYQNSRINSRLNSANKKTRKHLAKQPTLYQTEHQHEHQHSQQLQRINGIQVNDIIIPKLQFRQSQENQRSVKTMRDTVKIQPSLKAFHQDYRTNGDKIKIKQKQKQRSRSKRSSKDSRIVNPKIYFQKTQRIDHKSHFVLSPPLASVPVSSPSPPKLSPLPIHSSNCSKPYKINFTYMPSTPQYIRQNQSQFMPYSNSIGNGSPFSRPVSIAMPINVGVGSGVAFGRKNPMEMERKREMERKIGSEVVKRVPEGNGLLHYRRHSNNGSFVNPEQIKFSPQAKSQLQLLCKTQFSQQGPNTPNTNTNNRTSIIDPLSYNLFINAPNPIFSTNYNDNPNNIINIMQSRSTEKRSKSKSVNKNIIKKTHIGIANGIGIGMKNGQIVEDKKERANFKDQRKDRDEEEKDYVRQTEHGYEQKQSNQDIQQKRGRLYLNQMGLVINEKNNKDQKQKHNTQYTDNDNNNNKNNNDNDRQQHPKPSQLQNGPSSKTPKKPPSSNPNPLKIHYPIYSTIPKNNLSYISSEVSHSHANANVKTNANTNANSNNINGNKLEISKSYNAPTNYNYSNNITNAAGPNANTNRNRNTSINSNQNSNQNSNCNSNQNTNNKWKQHSQTRNNNQSKATHPHRHAHIKNTQITQQQQFPQKQPKSAKSPQHPYHHLYYNTVGGAQEIDPEIAVDLIKYL